MEGKDFQILGKFARILAHSRISNRSDFAVIPVEGFNPERIRNLKTGMEATLGRKMLAAALLDRDYRCGKERESIEKNCASFCEYVKIYRRKEIENFLLVPSAIDRAAERRVADRAKRTGEKLTYDSSATAILEKFAAERKSYVTAQYLASRQRFERLRSSGLSDASISENALVEFEETWDDLNSRLEMIPGKEAMGFLSHHFQTLYGVMLTASAILDAMRLEEVPEEMRQIISDLSLFAAAKTSVTIERVAAA
ncbi:MAG: hypothetical protein ACJ8DU_04700 [Microvirga sp.]